jgi:teichuronic acid biosynthesis glycosyltransferase TuaG
MQQDLVSVIMPTYNASAYLALSIDSILHQTYSNFELIITDDCSTDEETLKILANYEARDKRIQVFHLTRNQGAGIARNNSISHANGQFIAFCDSDDLWAPNKIELQVKFMRRHHCALCCSSYIICDKDGREVGIRHTPARITYTMMKHDNRIGCLTAVYDVKELGRKFYFPALRKRQDWGLFLQIIQQCHVAYAITAPLAYYRVRSRSLSRNKLSLVHYNIMVYRTILGYSRLYAFFYFVFIFLPTYFIKRIKIKYDSSIYVKCISSNSVNKISL